ncbi:MAG TPA: hypothetical protein VK918_01875 [Pyrinomonadaceae bacterium]|nr:hypothetical protein [Pyrinomonadaceae bacterium]
MAPNINTSATVIISAKSGRVANSTLAADTNVNTNGNLTANSDSNTR